MTRFEKLRALPCCQCGATPVDVAHANWGEFGKGMGKKANDAYTMGLCMPCYQAIDYCQIMDSKLTKAWFMRKLELVNGVLDGQERPTEPMF